MEERKNIVLKKLLEATRVAILHLEAIDPALAEYLKKEKIESEELLKGNIHPLAKCA
jgi:hypothetical protein